MTSWQASAAQLAGLLKLRDDVLTLAVAHENKAALYREMTTEGSTLAARAHESYAKKLRAILSTTK